MKKLIVPIIITIAVALSTYFFQAFTLLREEGLGLFLNTPDFYRTLFQHPFPISHIIGSFLVQFYSNYRLGIVIVTAMVLGVYFISRGLLSRIGLKQSALPSIACCAAWWFIARAEGPSTGVAILLISGVVLSLLAIFRLKVKRQFEMPLWLDIAISVIAIAATVATIGTSQKIKNVERWGRIEQAAIQENWNYLLKYATPADARKNLELTPWALLALNAQGRMEQECKNYPVAVDFGLDYGNIVSYHSCLFYSILYSKLGCYNESVRRTFLCGDYLPHGTSFRTLRMLTGENYNLQDSMMVVKYCDILSKSTLHGKFVNHYRTKPCPQRAYSPLDMSQGNPHLVYTKNQMGMLFQLYRAGQFNKMAEERYRCYLMYYGSEQKPENPENKEQSTVN